MLSALHNRLGLLVHGRHVHLRAEPAQVPTCLSGTLKKGCASRETLGSEQDLGTCGALGLSGKLARKSRPSVAHASSPLPGPREAEAGDGLELEAGLVALARLL